MTGLAHIGRFSRESARRVIERPDLHTLEHVRAACVWLVIHGDRLDVGRAAAVLQAVDQGTKLRSFPQRHEDVEGVVSVHRRWAAISAVACDRAHRVAVAHLARERDLLERRMSATDKLGWALVACMALIALAAAVGLVLTIGGQP